MLHRPENVTRGVFCAPQASDKPRSLKQILFSDTTGLPAVHATVGDPLQIYADRFSGHYALHTISPKFIYRVLRWR